MRVLEYLKVPKMSFWRGIDHNRPTKFPTTAFSDKSHSNSKNVKTKINKRLKNFRLSTTSCQKVNVMLIYKNNKSATISPVMGARSTSSQFQGISIEKHINSYLQRLSRCRTDTNSHGTNLKKSLASQAEKEEAGYSIFLPP